MYLVPCRRGHTAVVVVIIIIVTNMRPLRCIAQGLFPHLKLTLRCLDIKAVLFQPLPAFLFLVFLLLGRDPCNLRLVCLLLTSDGLRSIGCALPFQSYLHLGDCAHAQFIGNTKNIGVGWLRSHCVAKLTLVECKLWVGVGTSQNIPIGYPCARTILVWRLHHTIHLGLMGEDGSYSGETE